MLVVRTKAAAFALASVVVSLLIMGAGWDPWASEQTLKQNSGFPVPTSYKWEMPQISGSKVVYTREDPGAANWDVFCYDLAKDQESQLTTAANNQDMPHVSGDWAVWADTRDWATKNWDIYAKNLKTGVEIPVDNGAGWQLFPEVSGTRVIYTTAGGILKLFDLAKPSVPATTIATGVDVEEYGISGMRIAYAGGSDIYVHDLKTGTNTMIHDGSVLQASYPDIDGELVAYVVTADDDDIEGYDLSTDTTFTISDAAGDQVRPDVDGDRVVFADYQAGLTDPEIYLFDRRTMVGMLAPNPIRISQPSTAYDTLPVISGNTVIWLRGTSVGAGDLMRAELVAPQLTLSAASTGSYAVKPTFAGTLREGGVPLAGKTVDILKSTDGGHTWSQAAVATVTASGGYSAIAQSGITAKTLFMARFDGWTKLTGSPILFVSLDHLSARSGALSITPKAYLQTPSCVSTVRRNAAFVVSGALKPRHTAGTKPVRVYAYQRVNGAWKLRTSFYAGALDYSTYSKYRGTTRLPYTGYWRLRAYYPASSTNAATYSAYKYVRVD